MAAEASEVVELSTRTDDMFPVTEPVEVTEHAALADEALGNVVLEYDFKTLSLATLSSLEGLGQPKVSYTKDLAVADFETSNLRDGLSIIGTVPHITDEMTVLAARPDTRPDVQAAVRRIGRPLVSNGAPKGITPGKEVKLITAGWWAQNVHNRVYNSCEPLLGRAPSLEVTTFTEADAAYAWISEQHKHIDGEGIILPRSCHLPIDERLKMLVCPPPNPGGIPWTHAFVRTWRECDAESPHWFRPSLTTVTGTIDSATAYLGKLSYPKPPSISYGLAIRAVYPEILKRAQDATANLAVATDFLGCAGMTGVSPRIANSIDISSVTTFPYAEIITGLCVGAKMTTAGATGPLAVIPVVGPGAECYKTLLNMVFAGLFFSQSAAIDIADALNVTLTSLSYGVSSILRGRAAINMRTPPVTRLLLELFTLMEDCQTQISGTSVFGTPWTLPGLNLTPTPDGRDVGHRRRRRAPATDIQRIPFDNFGAGLDTLKARTPDLEPLNAFFDQIVALINAIIKTQTWQAKVNVANMENNNAAMNAGPETALDARALRGAYCTIMVIATEMCRTTGVLGSTGDCLLTMHFGVTQLIGFWRGTRDTTMMIGSGDDGREVVQALAIGVDHVFSIHMPQMDYDYWPPGARFTNAITVLRFLLSKFGVDMVGGDSNVWMSVDSVCTQVANYLTESTLSAQNWRDLRSQHVSLLGVVPDHPELQALLSECCSCTPWYEPPLVPTTVQRYCTLSVEFLEVLGTRPDEVLGLATVPHTNLGALDCMAMPYVAVGAMCQRQAHIKCGPTKAVLGIDKSPATVDRFSEIEENLLHCDDPDVAETTTFMPMSTVTYTPAGTTPILRTPEKGTYLVSHVDAFLLAAGRSLMPGYSLSSLNMYTYPLRGRPIQPEDRQPRRATGIERILSSDCCPPVETLVATHLLWRGATVELDKMSIQTKAPIPRVSYA